MSLITLRANQKTDGSYENTNYWKASDDGVLASTYNNLKVGASSNYINWRSRITFFPNSSIFSNQTIKSVTLTIKVKNLFSSSANTQNTTIKVSNNNEDTNTAYTQATECGPIGAKTEGSTFTFEFSGDGLKKISDYCKSGSQFSLYFGIDDNNGKYGLQYYGFKVSDAPILTIEYQPSASTGTISSNPKIGSPFTIYINKVSGTNYTHKIKISSSISDAFISSDILSTSITYQSFTISAANTLDWIDSSAISQRTNCLIETYSDGIKIGNYSFDFILNMADILDVTWSTYSITSSSSIDCLISGYSYPIIKLKATTTDGSIITKYRLEINSCGIQLNQTYTATNGELNQYLSNFKPYASIDTNFEVFAYAINSLGRESSKQTITKICYAYSLPSTILNPIRASNSSGTEDINGTYIYNKTALNYTSINGKNSITGITVKIEDTTISTVSYTQSYLTFYKSGASTENEYNITVTIQDRVSTNTIKAKIPSSNFLIHIKKGGKSIGIGRASRIIENTISLGWKLFIDNGIEFNNNSPISEIPLPVQNGGTGVTSYEALKQNLKLDYLPLSGGTINGSLNVNGNLSITNANSFTYNSNKVAIINDNIIISNREPNSNDEGLIWFRYE